MTQAPKAQTNPNRDREEAAKQSRAHIVSDADRIGRMKEDTVEADTVALQGRKTLARGANPWTSGVGKT